MDASAREEEARTGVKEAGWTRVAYNRPKAAPNSWRRREFRESGRERSGTGERRPNQGGKPKASGRREDRRCHSCGRTGHLVAQCPRAKCYECGNEGHMARNCPYIFRRRNMNQGEPMEVNAQRVGRRRILRRAYESDTESAETSETSETELEGGEKRFEKTRKETRRNLRCVPGERRPRFGELQRRRKAWRSANHLHGRSEMPYRHREFKHHRVQRSVRQAERRRGDTPGEGM
nr:branchpoint-bridging protein-like [Halyomorpha halys]